MAEVQYEKRDHVALIILNRPEKRNAWTFRMQDLLQEIWADFRDDPDIWVGVVTGAGESAFCAGQDIQELSDLLKKDAFRLGEGFWSLTGRNSLMTDEKIYKPVIAAINGHCLGIGLTLAMSCDIRLASSKATFGFPEVKIGVPTVMGALKMPRLIAMGAALELLLVGDPIGAEEAKSWGLINRIYEPGSVKDEAMKLAQRMCRNGPLAMNVTKEIAIRGHQLPFDDAWRLGEALRRLAMDSMDFREGLQAFLEKRSPKFRGR